LTINIYDAKVVINFHLFVSKKTKPPKGVFFYADNLLETEKR